MAISHQNKKDKEKAVLQKIKYVSLMQKRKTNQIVTYADLCK